MTKLVSLKDRPATREDIGKTVYSLTQDQITINNFFLEEMNQWGWFWQKPVIVSEEYLEELEANQIKGRCKECKFISCCDTYLKADCNCSQFEPKEAVKEGL